MIATGQMQPFVSDGANVFPGMDVFRQGSVYVPTETYIMNYLGDKILAWYDRSDTSGGMLINKIGVQSREQFTQNDSAGNLWKGKARTYTQSKTQYSYIPSASVPANYKLVTNSLTMSFWFKAATTGINGERPLIYYSTGSTDGTYGVSLNYLTKNLVLQATGSAGVKTVTSSGVDYCDDKWHHVVGIIYKDNYLKLYVDNSLIGTLSIVGITFANNTSNFAINYPLNGSVLAMRDVRLFPSAITSTSDIDKLYNQQYVSGACGWWPLEDDNYAYSVDVSGNNNHMTNMARDAESYITGLWPSLYNKYGYSDTIYNDLILDDGVFDNASEWTIGAHWGIADGVASFDGTAFATLVNKRITSIAAGDILKIEFTVVSGTAKIAFYSSVDMILTYASYATGSHTLYVKAIVNHPNVRIYGTTGGTACVIDNFKINKYFGYPIPPKIDKSIPDHDLLGNVLIFADKAKYNSIIEGDSIKMPDEGEIYSGTQLISVNDWFVNDTSQYVKWDSIKHQSGRQYVNNSEYILIRHDVQLTSTEDALLRSYMRYSESYNPLYVVDKAIGSTTGTTAEIYSDVVAVKAGTVNYENAFVSPIDMVPPKTPTGRYFAMCWDDYFNPEDQFIIAPLLVKYGFTSTFDRQVVPSDNNYYRNYKYDINKVKKIEYQGSWDASHGFMHISMLTSCPLFDGRTRPTNDELRVARADGTNALGFDIDSTLNSAFVASNVTGWLRLAFGTTAWKNLTDDQCQLYREAFGLFGMPYDAQSSQKVLESLDVLSARYCGTTGTSVYQDDYATRLPNTIDGSEPSDTNRILGGIFQGASTTQNHELWERVFYIFDKYKNEFEGKSKKTIHFKTPGGVLYDYGYKPVNPENGLHYHDTSYTKLFNGAATYISSITNQTRSLIDAFRAAGYKTGAYTQGDGYSLGGYDDINRLERQRMYKLNSQLTKPDDIGNGYSYNTRYLELDIPSKDQDTILSKSDVVLALYNYNDTCNRYLGDNGTTSFKTVIEKISRNSAWGIISEHAADSRPYTSPDAPKSSLALSMEALFQYCKRANIHVIGHEDAYDIAYRNPLTLSNYFPNPAFANLTSTVFTHNSIPTYPDGWNGGTVSGDTLTFSSGTFFTRQYAIKPGSVTLSIMAKGEGIIKVKKIRNNDVYSDASGSGYEDWITITVNNPNWDTETSSGTIENASMVTYSAQTTPQELVYQNYMKGLDNKICGLHIEVIIAADKTLKIVDPVLTIQ
jgi:hypothetical protein